jgi:hypothetical protein
MTGKTVLKALGVVGGITGAIAATLASGGTVGIAILVGLSTGATGASALFMDKPEKKETKLRRAKETIRAANQQAVDDEIPAEIRKPGAR